MQVDPSQYCHFAFKDLALQVGLHAQKLHTQFIDVIVMCLCKNILSHENVACYINVLLHVLALEDLMPLKLSDKSRGGEGGSNTEM